jgi:hypothetical protein
MPYADNVLSELRLSNFKAFSRLQRIPLKPITLIYGPNGSGKSSVLEGLKWAASLADGSPLASFDRYVRFHKADSSIDIGVDVTLAEINPWDPVVDQDFKWGLFKFLCESVRKISIDATVSRSGSAGPGILRVALQIDNQPFVTWAEQSRFSTLTAAFFERLNALCFATLNFSHPLLPLLLTRVKSRCLDILSTWAKNPVPGVTDQLSASEIESLRGQIDSFDPSSLTTDSLLSSIQDIQFTSTRLFPTPLEQHWLNLEDELEWMNFFKAAYGQDADKSSHGLPASEGIPGFFLGRFRELVVLFFNSLSDVSEISPFNDPLRNVTQVPAIRSIPAREFLLTDNEQRAAFAPDWKIRADAAGAERQISETNTWLAELQRIDTNYEVFCEPLEITFPNKPSSEAIRHLRFLGIRDKTTGTVVSLSETGTGFSQLLPVLLASFHGGRSSDVYPTTGASSASGASSRVGRPLCQAGPAIRR